jgi:hypothetical protein
VITGFAASGASGGWSDFVPRPYRNGAYLDLFASFERDENRSAEESSIWNDTFLREKVTLFSDGYFYHPRFLQYRLSLAGALKQEKYDAALPGSLGWSHDTGLEYDTKFILLPEHPYNLEIFALRYEPLFKENSATQHSNVETSHGASFQYRRKPYFLHTRYSEESIESALSTSDISRFIVDGTYFKNYGHGNELSLSAAYNPTTFTSSLDLDGTSNQYLFSGFLNLKDVRINSSVTRNTVDQESLALGRFETDSFAWHEMLTAYFPLHFRGDLSYRYHDNDNKRAAPVPSGVNDVSDTDEELQFDIVHRLFESLDTTYSYADSSRTSRSDDASAVSRGDADTLSQSLVVNYTKVIPRGRILIGVNRAGVKTHNRGQSEIVNEPHLSTALPGPFFLDQQDVDLPSISILLKSTIAPFNLIPLNTPANFIATTVGNQVSITVGTLPPPLLPGLYDVFASYSLTAGEFEIRIDTFGTNASVELLDNLLTPYVGYADVESKVLSGVFPGEPLDSKTYTSGLMFRRGPLRARGEYQKLQWDISPYRAWRADLQYVTSLNPTTSLYATGSYLDRYYPQGTSTGFREAYSDTSTSAAGNIQKQLLSRSLIVSAGGSFTFLRGLFDGETYSLNSSVTWRIGKLNLTAGASAYSSRTEGTTGVVNSRDHQYYYLNLRRQLF